jgi:hypothetical protein
MSDDFMENIDGLISDNSDSSDLSDNDESSSSPKSNVDSSSYDERYAEE